MTGTHLEDKLAQLTYPCALVVYHPGDDNQYSCFKTEIVQNAKEAWELIVDTQYVGWLNKMTIRAYHVHYLGEGLDYTDIT